MKDWKDLKPGDRFHDYIEGQRVAKYFAYELDGYIYFAVSLDELVKGKGLIREHKAQLI